MADYVRFKTLRLHNTNPALCQEDSIRHFLAFAGVHDVTALKVVDEPMDGPDLPDGWRDALGTWVINGDSRLDGVGDAGTRFHPIISGQTMPAGGVEVPIGFVCEFDKYCSVGAFHFMSDESANGYAFVWRSTTVEFISLAIDTPTVLASFPVTEAAQAHVRVAVWPQRRLAIDTIDQVTMSVWYDGKLIASHELLWGEAMDNSYFGFAAIGDNHCIVDNVTIPQLHQIVEYSSIDPGEAPASGMGRVIGQERIRVQARWDGQVLLRRAGDSTILWTLTSPRTMQWQRAKHLAWPTRVRMVGSLHEVDRHRYGTQGMVFDLTQDPNAFSLKTTYKRAGRAHREAQEGSEQWTFVLAPCPMIEAEDVIQFTDSYSGVSVTLRVTAIDYRIAWKGGQEGGVPVWESHVVCRLCIADEDPET